MAVDNVTTASGVGVDGNSYTTAVSNDKLTNDDFLQLMLTELKYQDPTEPMDSSSMMDSQMKMSTIEANQNMTAAMSSLQASFAQTSLSSATNIMGRTIENGTLNDDGSSKSYRVNTVELSDGDVYLNAQEIIGIRDNVFNPATETSINFDSNGQIYDGSGSKTNEFIVLDDSGRVVLDGGKPVVLDENGEKIIQADGEEYTYGGSEFVYSDTTTTLAYNDVTKIF